MLNGINLDGLNSAKQAITALPEAGIARYGVELDWQGGVKMIAKTLPMSVGTDKIERNFTWTIDEPPQLLGSSTGPTPQEYLMSGVGACIMVGFVVNAAIEGVALEKLSVRMSGNLDLAGFLNLRPDAEIKMGGLSYEINVTANAPQATLDKIAEKAFAFSPNAMTVVHGIPVSGKMTVVRPVTDAVGVK
ncbi:OsmC family protein [Borborobacter arsenicus]|nr:OsmC family protein [Pseudaminobacter arsenicus]